MLQLSPRLGKIASYVKMGESIADIGTDHGYLPIKLTMDGVSPHVILSDINEGPLDKARENINEHLGGRELDIRQGYGLECLKPEEVEVVVIAGMGGILISDILAKDIEKTRSFQRFILQPRNNSAILRRWLNTNDMTITDEQIVKEGEHFCEIIVAVPSGNETSEQIQKLKGVAYAEEMSGIPQEVLCEVPIMWLLSNDELVPEYLWFKLEKEKEKIEEISKNGSSDESKLALEKAIIRRDVLRSFFEPEAGE
jgi:tRNA (adenine22-N1)-methyltransferase